ncbi:hypothetical protein F5X99DRAFT_388296 [Biscogniauxia marginata]|nr:hypothetical protein F5X99DRAFT_388296 [Biscogniauxia marginata]
MVSKSTSALQSDNRSESVELSTLRADLAQWSEWNRIFLAALRVKGLVHHVLPGTQEPVVAATNDEPEGRLAALQLLEQALSHGMKCKLREQAGWDCAYERDPARMYEILCKVVTATQPSEPKSRSPLESATLAKDLRGEINLIETSDDHGWTTLSIPITSNKMLPSHRKVAKQPDSESMQDRIVRVKADLKALDAFYNIASSASRHARLDKFYADELADLAKQPFDKYAQDEKADYLLLKNYLRRAQRTLQLDRDRDAAFAPFVEPFAGPIKEWCEQRQRADEAVDAKATAQRFHAAEKIVSECQEHVRANKDQYSKATGYRAARTVAALRDHLAEAYAFYHGYDPLFDWWVTEPYGRLDAALAGTVDFLREALVGIKPGDEETIVGEPIGREGLLTDLEAEMIPYSPEELLRIAESEYAWCEAQMKAASQDLGFGDSWRDALEHVKDLYEPPGAQPRFIDTLVRDGASYVKEHDLVTVPRLAEEAIRMYMIPPARQKVSPFFLGGTYLQVSYPTSAMAHDDKLMSLRGNNRHFSRATAFHEMIPGHHLQGFVAERSPRHYRHLFNTPFFVEGWALYWEMVFWERGDFFVDGPEDRVGTLFWRMHRCARIVFSIKFHLGLMSAQECVDLLVDWVGHERATAEGEVRRSFNGDYSPLYQAGYMLGALQLMKLREEAVGEGHGKLGKKEFNDRVLHENVMPIEMLRALILGKELTEDFKSEWRFYGDKV